VTVELVGKKKKKEEKKTTQEEEEERNVRRILEGKPKGKRPLGRLRCR
jgi:hypothetical protein